LPRQSIHTPEPTKRKKRNIVMLFNFLISILIYLLDVVILLKVILKASMHINEKIKFNISR
jgi:hypothetical protein